MRQLKIISGLLAICLCLNGLVILALAEEEDEIGELIALWESFIEEGGGAWGLAPDNFGGQPNDDEIDMDSALRIAVKAILDDSKLTINDLKNFHPIISFVDTTGDLSVEMISDGKRAWTFVISNNDQTGRDKSGFIKGINVAVDASTGELLLLYARIVD